MGRRSGFVAVWLSSMGALPKADPETDAPGDDGVKEGGDRSIPKVTWWTESAFPAASTAKYSNVWRRSARMVTDPVTVNHSPRSIRYK